MHSFATPGKGDSGDFPGVPWSCLCSPAPFSNISEHQQLSEEKFLSSKCSVGQTVRAPWNPFLGIQERDTCLLATPPNTRAGEERASLHNTRQEATSPFHASSYSSWERQALQRGRWHLILTKFNSAGQCPFDYHILYIFLRQGEYFFANIRLNVNLLLIFNLKSTKTGCFFNASGSLIIVLLLCFPKFFSKFHL